MSEKRDIRERIIVISFIIMTILLISCFIMFNRRELLGNCPVNRLEPKLRNIYQHNGYWVISNFVENERWETNRCDADVTYAVQGDYEDIYKLEQLYSREPQGVMGFEEYTSFAVYIPNSEYMIQTRLAIAYVRYCLDDSLGELIRNYVSFHLYFSYDEELPFDSLPTKNFDDFASLSERNLSCSKVELNIYAANEKQFLFLGNSTQRHSNYEAVGKNIAQLEAHTNFILNGDLSYFPSGFIAITFKYEFNRFWSKLQKIHIENLVWRTPVLLTNHKQPYSHNARSSKLSLRNVNDADNTFLQPNKGDLFNVTFWLDHFSTENYQILDFCEHFEKFLEHKTFYIVDADFPLLDESAELNVDQSENLRIYTLQLLNYKFVGTDGIYLLHTIDADDEISHNQFDSIDKEIRLEYEYAYGGRLQPYVD